MSLILGYANKDNAIIMSDGRAGKDGSYSEHYNKTLKINDNIIIGFVGYVETIEQCIKYIFSEMGSDINAYYIEDYWELMQFLLDNDNARAHFKSSFIIMGRDRKHQMYTSTIGRVTDHRLEKTLVSAPRVASIGGTIDGDIIKDIYMRNITQYHIPIDTCMRTTIQEVAKLDPSVNTNCFVATI